MPFHDWENTPNFDPTRISVNSLHWVNYQGSLLSEAQEMAHNAHISQDFISSVIAGRAFADSSLLAFRDTSSFQAGELHRHINQWDKLFQSFNNTFSEALDWIHNFLLIKKEAIRELIITAINRLLAFLLIILLVRRFGQFICDTLIERLASATKAHWYMYM